MGNKGVKKHLKRKPAPKFWPIHRKRFIWTIKPTPGSHPISRSLPLALVSRDVLKLANTRKEAKKITSLGKILINGKIQHENRFPIGLMDILSIPDTKKTYRILPSKKGLLLHSIKKEELDYRLCRIENKTVVKSGQVQLNLHDGTNILIQSKDPKKPEEDTYQTLETLKVSISDKSIMGHMKLTTGAPAIIIGGKNIGQYGKITTIEEKADQKRKKWLVTIEDLQGNHYQTTLNFVFVLGDTEPLISLP